MLIRLLILIFLLNISKAESYSIEKIENFNYSVGELKSKFLEFLEFKPKFFGERSKFFNPGRGMSLYLFRFNNEEGIYIYNYEEVEDGLTLDIGASCITQLEDQVTIYPIKITFVRLNGELLIMNSHLEEYRCQDDISPIIKKKSEQYDNKVPIDIFHKICPIKINTRPWPDNMEAWCYYKKDEL